MHDVTRFFWRPAETRRAIAAATEDLEQVGQLVWWAVVADSVPATARAVKQGEPLQTRGIIAIRDSRS